MAIQLDPPVEARLREAATTRGVGADEYASRLIEEHLPPPQNMPEETGHSGLNTDPALVDSREQASQATLDIFEQWKAEDAKDHTDDPEVMARRQAEWEEFQDQLYRNRYGMSRRAGRRFGVSGKSTLERFRQMDSKGAEDYTEDPAELVRRSEEGEAFMRSLAQSRKETEGSNARNLWPPSQT